LNIFTLAPTASTLPARSEPTMYGLGRLIVTIPERM